MNLKQESKSSIEIRNFVVSDEIRRKETYKEIERDWYVILSSLASSSEVQKLEYHLIVTSNYDHFYSIYQTTNPKKAKEFFDYFVPILNPILRCKYSLNSLTKLLQKITKFSRLIKTNNWTLVHVIANFNLFEVFDLIKNSKQNNALTRRCLDDIMTNLNKQTKSKRFTALHLAIRKGHLRFAERLLNIAQQSIDFRLTDRRGNNVFHFAVLSEGKNKEFLKLLLANCTKDQLVDVLKAKNSRNCSPLHLACYSHSIECIKMILRIPLPIECFVVTNEHNEAFNQVQIGDQSKIIGQVDRENLIQSKERKNLENMTSAETSYESVDSRNVKATTSLQSDMNSEQNVRLVGSLSASSLTFSSNSMDKLTESSMHKEDSVEGKLDSNSSKSTQSKSADNLIQFSKNLISAFTDGEEDIFKGGTPLHWCKNKKYMGELLQMGFIKYVNVRNINQETALHVAVRRNNFKSIVILFCSGEKIDQSGDSLGNTPLHLAVNCGNLNLVKLLTVFGDEENLNYKNKLGITPRHLAAQNPIKTHGQILYALHAVGAKRCSSNEPDKSIDSSSGNLNLNAVSDSNMITSDLTNQTIQCNRGCIDEGDYNGINIYDLDDHDQESWFSNFITRRIIQNFPGKKSDKNFRQTESFASCAGNNSTQGEETKTKMNMIKKCLSRMKIKSKEKLTNSTRTGEKHDEKNDEKEQSCKRSNMRNRVLCIDGGGVKGIFAVQMLIELEKRLKHPLSSYFNWFAGTSTGSFISTLISLNYKPTDIRTLYFVIKNKVFQNYLPYDEEILESYLKKYLGDRTMSSITNCKLTITSTLYDRLPVQLHLFRNYPSPNELLGKPLPKARLDNKDKSYKYIPNYKEQVLWKACRASSAAPIYFNSFGSFCDGGLIANSPVMDVISEHFIYNELYEELNDTKNMNQELEFVLSIGCGQTNVRLNEYEYDFSSFSRVDRLLKFVINAKPFSLILISELNNTENHKQLRTMAWCKSMKIPYIRLSPFLVEKIKLDERNDEVLIDGLWKCKAYFHQKSELIDNLVQFLESIYEKPKDDRRKVPKFHINYVVDFDDTKLMPKELKKQIALNERLIDEVKAQSYSYDF